ncbi:MAG: polysaccharide deacetylase family protein [Candidatus Pacebacteria bacterium]|nr:polysaccharide deacetylase family protein [Candidatus Paceibacterota bacterium]
MLKERTKDFFYFFLNVLARFAVFFVRSPRASILMYHSISDNGVFFTVKPKDFEKQTEYLKSFGFKIISLAEMVEAIKSRNLKDKSVVLTFDDGYKDNYKNAWPVLKKYGFPAVIFLASDFTGKNFTVSSGQQLEILNEEEIKEMAEFGLVEFGSHTRTHPRLEKISDEEFEKEIRESKEALEKITGKRCRFFSYPKGYFRPAFGEILKRNGFEAAVSVKEGLVRSEDNLFLLRRNFVYSAGGFCQFVGKLGYSVPIYNFFKKFF